ncbi:ankyrin [Apiospora saccharicola]|uniref:Ankyrin n=1 Tax=Apiospora saccharicola TaxID=335842 RepID=A0ABR1U546_9PEZI
MSLLELPNEVIDQVLYQAIFCRDTHRNIKRSLRMRLVCKYFAEAVYPALFRTHRMDHAIWGRFRPNFLEFRYKEKRYGIGELWYRYLVYRVKTCGEGSTASGGRFVEIRDLARLLCEKHNTSPLDHRHVLETLCGLALDNIERGPGWFRYWGEGEAAWNKRRPNTNVLRPLDDGVAPDAGLSLLAAAMCLGMAALDTQLLAEGHDPTKSNFLFPSATQVAAECGNEGLLRILLEAREATTGLRSLEPGAQDLEAVTIFGAAVAGDIDLLKLGEAGEEKDRSFGNYTFRHGHPHPHSAVTSDIWTPHRWRTTLTMHAMRATESPAVYEYLAAAWAPAHGLSGNDSYEVLASHAGRGNLAMVSWLLETKGIHPNGPAAAAAEAEAVAGGSSSPYSKEP